MRKHAANSAVLPGEPSHPAPAHPAPAPALATAHPPRPPRQPHASCPAWGRNRDGTISIMIRGRQAGGNGMKPRIHRVQARWNPGFIASGAGPAKRHWVLAPRGRVFLEFAPIGDTENPVGNEFIAVEQILLWLDAGIVFAIGPGSEVKQCLGFTKCIVKRARRKLTNTCASSCLTGA